MGNSGEGDCCAAPCCAAMHYQQYYCSSTQNEMKEQVLFLVATFFPVHYNDAEHREASKSS